MCQNSEGKFRSLFRFEQGMCSLRLLLGRRRAGAVIFDGNFVNWSSDEFGGVVAALGPTLLINFRDGIGCDPFRAGGFLRCAWFFDA